MYLLLKSNIKTNKAGDRMPISDLHICHILDFLEWARLRDRNQYITSHGFGAVALKEACSA